MVNKLYLFCERNLNEKENLFVTVQVVSRIHCEMRTKTYIL